MIVAYTTTAGEECPDPTELQGGQRKPFKMATAAAIGFSDKLNEIPRSLRLSMTYDQSHEMVKHAEITL